MADPPHEDGRPMLATLMLTATLLAQSGAPQDTLVEPSSELKFARRPMIDGTQYLCLGTGIRKKAVFRVYAMVFCVDEKEGSAHLDRYFAEGEGKKHAALKGEALEEALREDGGFYRFLVQMPVAKLAELAFLRDVGQDSMKDSFTESLTKVLGKEKKAKVDRFVALLDRDLKKGDTILIRTSADGEIRLKLDQPKSLSDAELAPAIWQAYFGADAPSPALKKSVARGVAARRR